MREDFLAEPLCSGERRFAIRRICGLGVGKGGQELAKTFESRLRACVHEVHFGAVRSDRAHLRGGRIVRHDHGAALAVQLAGIGERLTEVAGRRGDEVSSLSLRGIVERCPKFEAPGVLQRLARERDIETDVPVEAR